MKPVSAAAFSGGQLAVSPPSAAYPVGAMAKEIWFPAFP